MYYLYIIGVLLVLLLTVCLILWFFSNKIWPLEFDGQD